MRPNHDAAEEEVEAPHRRRLATPSTTAASHGDQHSTAEPPQATRPLVDPRYRFLARFGATILSGGIAAIPMALYHYQAELSLVPQEVWFVGYILAHRWSDALPFPSLRRMSRRTGISTQMLHRYKQSLIEKGYLATIPRHRPSGGRTSNYYDFTGLFRALEELLQRDRRDASWGPSLDDDAGDDSASPDQFPLPGGTQLTAPGPAEALHTGPAPPVAPAPARQNVPRNKIPVVQIVSTEEENVETRVPRQTPKRDLRNDESAPKPVIDPHWAAALERLSQELTPAAFSAWIAPLEPVPAVSPGTSDGEDRLTLRCSSSFHLHQVDRRYREAIERALGRQIGLIHDNHN